MTENNSISVICPTYNSDSYVEQTLSSLLNQSISPDEIIFSDDGSTDNTVKILEDWKCRFEVLGINTLILINSHKGPGATRNIAIEHSTNEWISFLDADDIWKKDKISRIKEMIKKFPNNNVFLHGEEYVRLDGKKTIMMHGENYKVDKPLSRQLYLRCFFSTSAITLNKNALINGIFDSSLPNGQDYELWLRSSPYMKLCVVPEILGEYVEQSSSITARPYYQRYFSQVRILARHFEKGGVLLACYMILRVTLSKQWFSMMQQWISGTQKHSG